MTRLSRHIVVAPIPAAPLLTDIRRSAVGSGTREDIVTMPDELWVPDEFHVRDLHRARHVRDVPEGKQTRVKLHFSFEIFNLMHNEDLPLQESRMLNKLANLECSGCIIVGSCRSAAATCKRSQVLCTSERRRGELQLSIGKMLVFCDNFGILSTAVSGKSSVLE